MRLLLTMVIVGLAVACSARPADDDYVYDDDAPAEVAPAPSTKAPARHALVGSRTARGPSPLIGARGVKTTAAPVKAAEPEVVNEPEEVEEEEGAENEEAVAVTTEAPKKGLMRNVVRPFRSNQDLLAALKRKRQQEHWRVVYEYLYVRFGYPVNLHHNLDLSPDADIDARSEINEVTSGDHDPPPKFKTGDHELVTDRVPTQVETAQVEPVKVELERVELANTEPPKVELEKVESVVTTQVEPEKVESVVTTQVKLEKVESVVTTQVEPEQVKSILATKVEPAKVEPAKFEPAKVNGTLSTSASFSVSYS